MSVDPIFLLHLHKANTYGSINTVIVKKILLFLYFIDVCTLPRRLLHLLTFSNQLFVDPICKNKEKHFSPFLYSALLLACDGKPCCSKLLFIRRNLLVK